MVWSLGLKRTNPASSRTSRRSPGRDPKGVIRDSEVNRRVPLPNIGRKLYVDGMTREFRKAMGLE